MSLVIASHLVRHCEPAKQSRCESGLWIASQARNDGCKCHSQARNDGCKCHSQARNDSLYPQHLLFHSGVNVILKLAMTGVNVIYVCLILSSDSRKDGGTRDNRWTQIP